MTTVDTESTYRWIKPCTEEEYSKAKAIIDAKEKNGEFDICILVHNTMEEYQPDFFD